MSSRQWIALFCFIVSAVMMLAIGPPDDQNPLGFWFVAFVASLIWMVVEKIRRGRQGR